jgi:hypothetical protein
VADVIADDDQIHSQNQSPKAAAAPLPCQDTAP